VVWTTSPATLLPDCGNDEAHPLTPYSVVREVGIRLRDTEAVGSCVELTALRCSRARLDSWRRGQIDEPTVLRTPTAPATDGRLAAEPHRRGMPTHDKAALPWLEVKEPDTHPSMQLPRYGCMWTLL